MMSATHSTYDKLIKIPLFSLMMCAHACQGDIKVEDVALPAEVDAGAGSELFNEQQDADVNQAEDECVRGFNSELSEPLRTFETIDEGRYCEVLIVYDGEEGTRVADVYNSIPFGDCPQGAWESLDMATIQAEFPEARSIILNGPRYFLMQDLFGHAANVQRPPSIHTFGEIQMIKAATVEAEGIEQSTYIAATVVRTNTWRFQSGQRVHELIDIDGQVYIMQSFARIVDEALTYEGLETLGDRLTLPEGWRYRVRTLDSVLDVQAEGTAKVLQDELQNTYQLRSDCQIKE